MPTVLQLPVRALENGSVCFRDRGWLESFCALWGNFSSSDGLLPGLRVFVLMTLNALKHRDITKINWMLEWLVSFMAIVAFVVGE